MSPDTITAIKYMILINTLTKQSKRGIIPFSRARPSEQNDLLYDDGMLIEKCEDACGVTRSYPLIGLCEISNKKRSVISYMQEDLDTDDVKISVYVSDTDGKWIEIRFLGTDDSVVIENGRSHFVGL